GGMMLSNGVNDTPLAKRVVYIILKFTSQSTNMLLLGIILLPQILAIFIPASAVRVALILPIVILLSNLKSLNTQENYRKQMLLGLAYGGNISGTGVLTAAISNIILVDILTLYTGQKISYFNWFVYAFPIWILSIPITWFIVVKSFKTTSIKLTAVKGEIDDQLHKLGQLNRKEKRCILNLLITVVLWFTEPFNRLHTEFKMLISVFLI